mmetsp:Transcript_78053/g.155135  ORF Transcript_78053/g.155135 Transcript_78053/m.155135 type:complete len:203 (+) Transcript_78053:126-734(+)
MRKQGGGQRLDLARCGRVGALTARNHLPWQCDGVFCGEFCKVLRRGRQQHLRVRCAAPHQREHKRGLVHDRSSRWDDAIRGRPHSSFGCHACEYRLWRGISPRRGTAPAVDDLIDFPTFCGPLFHDFPHRDRVSGGMYLLIGPNFRGLGVRFRLQFGGRLLKFASLRGPFGHLGVDDDCTALCSSVQCFLMCPCFLLSHLLH